MAIGKKTNPEEEPLNKVYDLVWIDLAYEASQDKPIVEFERKRRFKHCGGAIAWARRKIYHGDLFGDSIEMKTVSVGTSFGDVYEREIDVVDITLAGFCRWKQGTLSGTNRVQFGKPERKCRAAQL